MPKQSLDLYVADALSWLDQVDKESDPGKRASLYETLADRFRLLHIYGHSIEMYGRSIEMYRQSRKEYDAWSRVRRNLAELLTRLYGKDGFEDAWAQARDYVPLQRPVALEIERKQAAEREYSCTARPGPEGGIRRRVNPKGRFAC